jgi:drug/metabolite transporter (DMT)-like permease
MKVNWEEAKGYAFCLLAACFWGGAASIGKSLMQRGLSTLMLMQVRSVISAAIIVFILILFSGSHLRIQRKELPALILLAIPGIALVNISYYHAVKLLPVAIAVFIQFTAPVLVFLYGLLSKREHSSPVKFAALLFCIFGTFLMVQLQQGSLRGLSSIGLASAVISMFTYAFYVILSHRLGEKHSAWTLLAYGYGITAIFWCILQNPNETIRHLTDNTLWRDGIIFALCSTLIPFSFFLLGLRKISATGAAIASTAETVSASLFAFIFLHESLTIWQILGASLILSSIMILIYKGDTPTPVIPEEPEAAIV